MFRSINISYFDYQETAGVDMVISVDLQRPGQGHEACFFDTSIPVETVNSNITMAEFFKKSVPLSSKVVVVAANPNCAKKAIGFRDILSDSSKIKADHAIYLHSTDPQRESEFLGSVEGKGLLYTILFHSSDSELNFF